MFSSMGQTVSVEKDKKLKSVEVNRNILGLLLSASTKSGQVIDFAKALEYHQVQSHLVWPTLMAPVE